MAGKQISVEDFTTISNLVGRYQFLVDEADEGWLDLFTEDGAFLGFGEPLRGREALKNVLAMTRAHDGKMRHLVGSLSIAYGASSDEAYARYYNLLTTWHPAEGAKLHTFAISTMRLVRRTGDWKIKSVELKVMSNP